MAGMLEVAVRVAADVVGAEKGGADRLALVAGGPGGGMSPSMEVASEVLRAARVPVRVMLRLNEGFSTDGGEFSRLIALGEKYVQLGAEGVVFGFLDADLEVDVATCEALAIALPGVPWTFHRAIDSTLDPRRSWRRLINLPGLSAVRTAGSPQGLGQGFEALLDQVRASPDVARLAMPGGGLLAEHVPWLARAGVTQFHLGAQARPGGSYKAYVAERFVRSWRTLLDDIT